MGNIIGRPDYRGIMVDGGQAQIKEKIKRSESGLATTTINNTAVNRARLAELNEYDPVLVGKLINSKRLAPFYEGKFDEKGDGRSIGGGGGGARSDRASIMTSESRRRLNVASQGSKKTVKSTKSGKKKKKDTVVDQAWLTTQLIECPICLLWYPRNINYSKCCKKPICTLCFVSMKRPNNPSKLISCPFCRDPNLTVIYRSPERILEHGRYKSGVACEEVRPARVVVYQPPRPMYRYNIAGGPPGQTTFAQPRQSTNGRFTFYNPQNSLAGRGPSYPARATLTSPTRLPAATSGQTSLVSGRSAAGQMHRQMTQQEVQSYEERVLSRALMISMLEY